MLYRCLRYISSVSRAVTRVCGSLPAADGLQVRLGSGEPLLLLPQASLQIFVQVVRDGVCGASAQLLVPQVLQLGARVSSREPAGDSVLTPAEAAEPVTLIAQIRSFTAHVLAHVVEEAALLSVHTLSVSLLEETHTPALTNTHN